MNAVTSVATEQVCLCLQPLHSQQPEWDPLRGRIGGEKSEPEENTGPAVASSRA